MYVAGLLTEANSGAHHTERESVSVTRELIKNVHVYNYPDLVLRVICATESVSPLYARNSCWHLILPNPPITQSYFKTTKMKNNDLYST